jgi:uncharacterized protein YndB with AHSA1/START domain
MNEHSTNHSTFVIERSFTSTPEKVFAAFTTEEAKYTWFAGPGDWVEKSQHFDFKVGGSEHVSRGPADGPTHTFEATYYDIVPNERIIYSYDMYLDDKRISVSLATLEFKPEGMGTKLTLTEQGIYLDSLDDPTQREQGTNGLLDELVKYVDSTLDVHDTV